MTLIDASVGLALFLLGVALAVRGYGTHDRATFAVVAALTPLIVIFAVFQTLLAHVRGGAHVGPCPPGLDEAEHEMQLEKQRMFDGEIRQTTYVAAWKLAYERELQRDADQVRKVAVKLLVFAH